MNERRNHGTYFMWWAAKRGFSGVHWSSPWIRALNSAWLPGPDFFVKEVSVNGSNLCKRVEHF